MINIRYYYWKRHLQCGCRCLAVAGTFIGAMWELFSPGATVSSQVWGFTCTVLWLPVYMTWLTNGSLFLLLWSQHILLQNNLSTGGLHVLIQLVFSSYKWWDFGWGRTSGALEFNMWNIRPRRLRLWNISARWLRLWNISSRGLGYWIQAHRGAYCI